MSSRWNDDIDNQLKVLYEEERIGNWVQISERLNEIFGHPLRHPKQCRERYVNAVKFKGSNQSWIQAQYEILRDEFLELGPKWAIISKKIPGRGQNTIKNKFNAQLRKSIRKLNNLSKKLKLKHRKPICTEWFRKLTKVVFEGDNFPSQKKSYAQKLMKQFIEAIFLNSVAEQSESDEEPYLKLLQNICTYNKNYLFSKIKENAIFVSKNGEEFVASSEKASNQTPENSLYSEEKSEKLEDGHQVSQQILNESLLELGVSSQLQYQIKLNSPSLACLISDILDSGFQKLDYLENNRFPDYLQLSN